ncbi:hypothetical protein TNCV_806221 [Trichonephila clavipes]|nr:hypothetical protein TNCV_806221 [Trichonephila clavipes]
MAEKDILEFVQSSKTIIDTDSDNENEMTNANPVPTSSEMRNIMKKKSPIHSLSVIPHRVGVSSLAPNPPCSCSFAISTVPKSALLRGLRIRLIRGPIVVLSLIETQTVSGSPQFGFRCTSRFPYCFFSIAEGTSPGLSQKFRLSQALSLPLYISLSNHISPNHPSVISCSSVAPVGLSPFDL